MHRLRLTLLLATVAPAFSLAADVYVVTHPGVKLGADQIRDVYVGEKQFAGDVKLTPLDNAAAQQDFLSRALKLDATKYDNLWTRKSFRDALNPPAVKTSDREILDIVRKTPGAIGYVTSPPPAGVTVVQKF